MPREAVESFIDTPAEGNIFNKVEEGLSINLRAFNSSEKEQVVTGRLTVTDFFDKRVYDTQASLTMAAKSGGSRTFNGLMKGSRGFFRANWSNQAVTQSIRCAILEPSKDTGRNGILGFNHAYPWDFLVQQAQRAGVKWWRDLVGQMADG